MSICCAGNEFNFISLIHLRTFRHSDGSQVTAPMPFPFAIVKMRSSNNKEVDRHHKRFSHDQYLWLANHLCKNIEQN
jgi:hypothetical protein